MKITLASVGAHRTRAKTGETDRLIEEYVLRASRYVATETVLYESEAALLGSVGRAPGRVAAYLVLLDARGQMLTSEEFARHLGKQRDEGAQRVVLAIGPADGWSEEARRGAPMLFSLGRITLPHQLARAVLAEQVYRALTILAGHPYHCGH